MPYQYVFLVEDVHGNCSIIDCFVYCSQVCLWFILQNDQDGPSTSEQNGRNAEPSHFAILAKAEELAKRIWAAGWLVVHHNHLPKWLRDNDFLVKGHRPPMNSFWKCFKSVFRVHTETGNIWTHLLGKCISCFLKFFLTYVRCIKFGNNDLFSEKICDRNKNSLLPELS